MGVYYDTESDDSIDAEGFPHDSVTDEQRVVYIIAHMLTKLDAENGWMFSSLRMQSEAQDKHLYLNLV